MTTATESPPLAPADDADASSAGQAESPTPDTRRPQLVSIILATYNERENICHTIIEIFKHVCPQISDGVEIIVVDDDSPDETWKLVSQLEDPRVKLIRRVSTRGLASAFNRGIIESRGDVVGWMDADMCMPPHLLPDMIAKLRDHDVVVGSRYAAGASDNRHWLRVLASRCINRFAGLVLGFGIKDYDSGFVVLRRTVFDRVSLIPTGYGAYFMEFLYTCRRKGLTVHEVPYAFTDRTKGVSKSAPSLWRFCWTGAGYVLRVLVARLRRID
ncbi:MAG TPA: polyprenol monophosphomannose synthase [Phycisphaerae bacterium]|nr:polyprenol monophosphomannose synthase [Phycisphaerae bacterium]